MASACADCSITVRLPTVTIAEHLHLQVRIYNRVKWAGVLVVVVLVFHQVYLKHSNVEMYAWIAGPIIPWLVACSVYGRRIRCPRCQTKLFKELASNTSTGFTLVRDARRELQGQDPLRLDACPQCGCRFNEPYVGG